MTYRTEETDEIRLIQEIAYKGRTILTWYNQTKKLFSLTIFNYRDQPNIVAKLSTLTNWGYPTYHGEESEDHAEGAEISALFIEDLLKENYWWENDANFFIPEETWKLLEEVTGEVRGVQEDLTIKRPKLTLIKNEE